MARIIQDDMRWGPRQQVNLDIMLHVSGQFPFPGVIRNVSLGGLFVETDTTRLHGDAGLFVAFTIRTKAGTHHYREPARINRQGTNGVALVFTMPDSGVRHGLRQLLYPTPVVALAPSHATFPRPAG